jgi:hypothetical protein
MENVFHRARKTLAPSQHAVVRMIRDAIEENALQQSLFGLLCPPPAAKIKETYA